jgi:NADH-quinone oxidoreductase subunit L
VDHLFAPLGHAPLAGLLGLAATTVGFSLAWVLYRRAEQDPLPGLAGCLSRWMRDRFYFDEFYKWLIKVTQDALAGLADWVDRWLVAGVMIRGLHGSVEIVGRALRLVQTGNLQTYVFLFAAGVVVLLYLTLGQ